MIQRNIAGRPQPRHRAAHRRPSSKVVLQPRDHAPVRRPVQRRARARSCASSLAGTEQYQRNVQDAQGWQETSELGAVARSPTPSQRARELLVAGRLGLHRRRSSREAIAKEIDQLIAGVKQSANATYRRPLRLRRHHDRPAAVRSTAPTTPTRARATVVARQIGPGVSLEIGVTGDVVPRLGAAAADGKLLDTPARHRRAPARRRRRRRCAAPTSTQLDAQPRRPARRARAQRRARRTGSRRRSSRLAEVEEATLTQLSETEDADIAKTLIELQLAAGRLPGRPEGRGEHRPGLAHGLPPLIRPPKETPFPCPLTFDSTRFGTLEIDARRRDRVPHRPDRPRRLALRARRAPTRTRRSPGCTRSTTPTSRCPVTNPWLHFGDYEVELSDADTARVGAEDPVAGRRLGHRSGRRRALGLQLQPPRADRGLEGPRPPGDQRGAGRPRPRPAVPRGRRRSRGLAPHTVPVALSKEETQPCSSSPASQARRSCSATTSSST